MNLEPKHIAPYVPHRLQAKMLDCKIDYVNKEIDTIVGIHQWDKTDKFWSVLTVGGSKPALDRIKPLLRPLKDINKMITYSGVSFRPIDEFFIMFGGGVGNNDVAISQWKDEFMDNILYSTIGAIDFLTVSKLIEWHFDIYHLIENNLAESL